LSTNTADRVSAARCFENERLCRPDRPRRRRRPAYARLAFSSQPGDHFFLLKNLRARKPTDLSQAVRRLFELDERLRRVWSPECTVGPSRSHRRSASRLVIVKAPSINIDAARAWINPPLNFGENSADEDHSFAGDLAVSWKMIDEVQPQSRRRRRHLAHRVICGNLPIREGIWLRDSASKHTLSLPAMKSGITEPIAPTILIRRRWASVERSRCSRVRPARACRRPRSRSNRFSLQHRARQIRQLSQKFQRPAVAFADRP